jgi:hypothetical protein
MEAANVRDTGDTQAGVSNSTIMHATKHTIGALATGGILDHIRIIFIISRPLAC